MNPLGTILLLLCIAGILSVSTRNAPIPFLIGCSYLTVGQGFEIAGFNFPAYRVLLLAGLFRAITRHEISLKDRNAIDNLVIILGFWCLFASLFHERSPGSGPAYVSGIVFNVWLIYFLLRSWCREINQIHLLIASISTILVPVAIAMLVEKSTGRNVFGFLGGVNELSLVRGGKIRAAGPFRHPILAGTVGATLFPLFVSLFRHSRTSSIVGILCSFIMVTASASSGPIMSLTVSAIGLLFWPFRKLLRLLQFSLLITYVSYSTLSSLPGYYILGKIDLTGGSTGRFRADLIRASIYYLDEWWLFGTDRTRHWMNSGVSWSDQHTDITNYYLGFGVMAGLPALIIVVLIIIFSFVYVGRVVKGSIPEGLAFTAWCIGCGILSHAATSISVSYFDQSVAFFWMNIALASVVYDYHSVTGRTMAEHLNLREGVPEH